MARTAIIAGGGALPGMIAESCRRLGRDYFIVALRGVTDPDWARQHTHKWFRLGQVGAVIRELQRQKIETLVFAGHVQRPSLKNIWQQLRPDMLGVKLFWRLRKRKMGDDDLLRSIAGFFEGYGIQVIGASDIVTDSLMPQGVLTDKQPDSDEWRDIDYAANLLRIWAQLDQGQAIVVQHGLILGVEAAEGTDELIRRCGQYKRAGRGPILVKIKKPQQDRRLDLPTIGLDTIRNAVAAGFSGIAVQADEALFLHPIPALQEANRHKCFVVGFEPKNSGP